MARSTSILINCLNNYMEQNHISELSAPDAAEILDRAGLLKDNPDRKGLPLRRILRDGGFGDNAYQIGRIWHIRKS